MLFASFHYHRKSSLFRRLQSSFHEISRERFLWGLHQQSPVCKSLHINLTLLGFNYIGTSMQLVLNSMLTSINSVFLSLVKLLHWLCSIFPTDLMTWHNLRCRFVKKSNNSWGNWVTIPKNYHMFIWRPYTKKFHVSVSYPCILTYWSMYCTIQYASRVRSRRVA